MAGCVPPYRQGALTLGYGVAKTIQGTSKTDDPDCWACGYCDSEMSLFMVAMMSSLFAAALFLLLGGAGETKRTYDPISGPCAEVNGVA